MSLNIIRVKINVTRILKEHLFQGKNGKYLDLSLLPLKSGPDQFGNEYTVVQDIGKEARQRGEKGPFIGNAKVMQTAKAPDSAPAHRDGPNTDYNPDVGF